MLDPIRYSWEARTHPMINTFLDPIRSLDEKHTHNMSEKWRSYPRVNMQLVQRMSTERDPTKSRFFVRFFGKGRRVRKVDLGRSEET